MYFTISELFDEVDQLNEIDIKKLHYVAMRNLPAGLVFGDAEDIVQEAITRVLSGTWEKLRKDEPFLKGLAWIVKSIASSHKKTNRADVRLTTNAKQNAKVSTEDLEETPDKNVLDQKITILLRSLNGDQECEKLIELMLCGLTKTKIIENMKISNTQYESIYRRMKRKLIKIDLSEVEA